MRVACRDRIVSSTQIAHRYKKYSKYQSQTLVSVITTDEQGTPTFDRRTR
jgi:hypothetical protein